MSDETGTVEAEALAAANRHLAQRVLELLGTEEQFELYAEDIVMEVAASRLTERGATRADDRVSEAAMEDRKREGYF